MRAVKNRLTLNIRSGAKHQWSLSSLKPPLVNICNVNNSIGLQKAVSGHIRLMSNADVSYNESLVNGQILRPLFYPKVDIKASNLD